MSRSFRGSGTGTTRAGSFVIEARIEDKAVRDALKKVRKNINKDAKAAMLAAVEAHMPEIRAGIPLGTRKGGHLRNKITVRARAGGYPYITGKGRAAQDQLYLVEFGGVRTDTVYGKKMVAASLTADGGVRGRHRQVLWSGKRVHPKRRYVNKSLTKNAPGIGDDVRDALVGVMQKYLDQAASTSRATTS